MKRSSFLILFLSLNFAVFAQLTDDNYRKVCRDLLRNAISTKSVNKIDSTIIFNQNNTPEFCSYLSSIKVQALMKIYRKDLENFDSNNPMQKAKYDEIMAVFEQAINGCKGCELKTREARSDFLSELTYKNNQINIDKEYIKRYKKDRTGIGLSADFWAGKNLWAGGEITFVKGMINKYKIANVDSITKKITRSKLKQTTNINILSFGYHYNWTQKINDFSFSPIHLDAPLLLHPLSFGLQYSASDFINHWYYKPEIGFGYGPFSFSYAYYIYFDKLLQNNRERSMFNIRFSQVIVPFHKK